MLLNPALSYPFPAFKKLNELFSPVLLHEDHFFSFLSGRRKTTVPENHFSTLPLDVKNITFSYGKKNILKNIGFSVGKGEICGLFGPNGCGKSTLFRCCTGFLHPSSGHIHVNNVNVAHMRPEKLARYIAYVPQEHSRPFPFSVFEMILMGRTPYLTGHFSIPTRDREITEEAMERVGISPLADTPFTRLSGGQRQLTLIARALAQQTPVILLDEPTASLDFFNQIAVWKILRSIAEQGSSILVCSHDPNHMLWFSDRVVIMRSGTVIAEGKTDTTLTRDILEQAYQQPCEKISTGSKSIFYPK